MDSEDMEARRMQPLRTTLHDALRRELSRGVEQLDRGEGRDADDVFADLLRDLPNPDQD